ncbi:MAG TPA: long-chain fatty acid--CoA ligase [Acidimicrobiales bacterium]|nr:long-chain fatty acid--CoA ligase [Acidimicrobiales bacterium]
MAVLSPMRAITQRGGVPAAPPMEAGLTLVDLFFDRVARWPDRPALRYTSDGEWMSIRWATYGETVREVAAGLIALGTQPGDRIGILAGNQPRWHMADLAIMTAGAVSVPAYPTGAASQVAHVFGHSGSRLSFVGDRDQLAKLLLARPRLPGLERIVMLGEPPDGLDDDVLLTFDDVRSLGRDHLARHPGAVDERVAGLRPDLIATIVYTSGTTGPPKGAMITHDNLAETIRAVIRVVTVGPTDRFLSFLPLSHIAERVVSHFGQIVSGGETWFARSLATVVDDLRACRPTVFFAVPRVWEKFRQAIESELGRTPSPLRSQADRLVELGLAAAAAREGRGLPLQGADRVAHVVLSRTIGAGIRHRIGLDRGRIFVSAAAPVDPGLLLWFHAIGIPVAEVYGQTEDCGPATLNRPGRNRVGTVGEPLPGVKIRIGPDDEVLVGGPTVCAGYWQDPEATAELLDEDGWMHSGDLGRLDDGYLRLTGRKKDLIVTSSGKNIAPQDMETRLRSEPYIAQAIVVGEGRSFLTALVALDAEYIDSVLGDGHGAWDAEALATHPTVEAEIAASMERLNAERAPAERIRAWRILPRELTVSGGELTPTLKVRRSVVVERFGDMVEEMYAR